MSKTLQNIDKNSEEYKTVYELELWKRAEQAKFKNHLKQIELETIENVTKDWRLKEQVRDDELNSKIGQLDTLEKKLRAKAQEMQKRESKITQLEDELKFKIQEASRQLAVKEDEIVNIKKRFKEERTALQNDKKNLQSQLDDSKNFLNEVETRFRAYRQDMEESPLTVLRTEIGNKNIKIAELTAQLQKSNDEKI